MESTIGGKLSETDEGESAASTGREQAHDEDSETSTTATGGTVLVVDDDEAFAETVEIWLQPEWAVVLAHDGDEAVEAYGPGIDAVLLDRRMPTMSGDETLTRIRDQAGSPGIAIMSAVEPDDHIDAEAYDLYLEKPVTRDDLVDAVETLLQ